MIKSSSISRSGVSLIIACMQHFCYAQAPALAIENPTTKEVFSEFKFTERVRQVLIPFCVQVGTIHANLVKPTPAVDNFPELFEVTEGGVAFNAGLRSGDVLQSVDGSSLQNMSILEIRNKVLLPQMTKAVENKQAIVLSVRSSNINSQARSVSIMPSLECFVHATSKFKMRTGEPKWIKEKYAVDQPKIDPTTSLKFSIAKIKSFEALESMSFADATAQLYSFLEALTLRTNRGGVSGTTYSTNDYLRTDLLAMIVLLQMGESIEHYSEWAWERGMPWPMSFADTRDEQRSYFVGNYEILQKLQQLVLVGRLIEAAKLIDFDIKPRQRQFFETLTQQKANETIK
jgi:hypothetical protein